MCLKRGIHGGSVGLWGFRSSPAYHEGAGHHEVTSRDATGRRLSAYGNVRKVTSGGCLSALDNAGLLPPGGVRNTAHHVPLCATSVRGLMAGARNDRDSREWWSVGTALVRVRYGTPGVSRCLVMPRCAIYAAVERLPGRSASMPAERITGGLLAHSWTSFGLVLDDSRVVHSFTRYRFGTGLVRGRYRSPGEPVAARVVFGIVQACFRLFQGSSLFFAFELVSRCGDAESWREHWIPQFRVFACHPWGLHRFMGVPSTAVYQGLVFPSGCHARTREEISGFGLSACGTGMPGARHVIAGCRGERDSTPPARHLDRDLHVVTPSCSAARRLALDCRPSIARCAISASR